MFETRERLISDWKNDGIKVIEESIWSSSIQLENLPRIREFLSFYSLNMLILVLLDHSIIILKG